MKTRPSRILRTMQAGTVGLALTSCSGDSIGPWKEEVLLEDGRVIVVERSEKLDSHSPMGDVGASFIKMATLRFISPVELSKLPMVSTATRPILVDFDAERGQWFLIGVNERACWPTPDQLAAGHLDPSGRINIHPNFEFRLIGDNWQEVAIDPSHIGRSANLLVTRTTIGSWDVVPLAEKRRLDGHPRMPSEYRKVVRQIGCG